MLNPLFMIVGPKYWELPEEKVAAAVATEVGGVGEGGGWILEKPAEGLERMPPCSLRRRRNTLSSSTGKQSMSSASASSSPPRARKQKDEERPRFFDIKAKSMCWANADTVPGRHPDRWRKDPAGNVVCKRFCNCQGCLCFEYDHIVPFSKGGESVVENCQILQTRVNRFKSDKEDIDGSTLKGYSCDIKFTDKELDIVEMAVYGDVIRPGNQCRCRTVAEMLGQYKPKDRLSPCKLPYDNNSSEK
ncbi:HNH endonuclease domain-containing protein [Perilla frutescens var. frutescens]|nr:HNH endonuclease domain-containing protein [Perilla frutescens var. frutescens]